MSFVGCETIGPVLWSDGRATRYYDDSDGSSRGDGGRGRALSSHVMITVSSIVVYTFVRLVAYGGGDCGA